MVLAATVLVLGHAVAQGDRAGGQELPHLHAGPSAAIVDQLGLTDPNATFVREALLILSEAGYVVDYYPGENVTVDLYRRLPHLGYDVLVLRTHSALHTGPDGDVVLFTREEYRPVRHVGNQRMAGLARVAYDLEQYEEDGRTWYGVRPRLLEEARGGFDGAVVLAMGCQGLANDSLAKTFLERGASAYVGWNNLVTADRTDAATVELLEAWLSGPASLSDAVEAAMDAVGEDPLHRSRLGVVERAAA